MKYKIVAIILAIMAMVASVWTIEAAHANPSPATVVSLPTLPPLPTTVPLPTVTKTKLVVLPQATKTVIKPRPGPTRTVVQTRQGPTVRVTVTPKPGPTVTATVTASPTRPPYTVKTRTLYISVPKAIGFSIGLLVLGILAGSAALWIAYISGALDSKRHETEALQDLHDELF